MQKTGYVANDDLLDGDPSNNHPYNFGVTSISQLNQELFLHTRALYLGVLSNMQSAFD